MSTQVTDWGGIEWQDQKTAEGRGVSLRTGIVTIRTGARQPRHVHFEEQVIYVLQGEACSAINGKEEILKAGALRHWRAGVEHEIRNLGEVPFQHLLISNPGSLEPVLMTGRESAGAADPSVIYEAVEAVRLQFLETLHYSYVIFDASGNLILQSPHFPRYCEECCRPSEHPGACPCMLRVMERDPKEEQAVRCPYGMQVYHFPVLFRGNLMGIVQGGYLRYLSEEKGKIETVYDAPESMVSGMIALFTRIVKAIRNYCEFEHFRRELTEKELHIANAKEQQDLLARNLRDTQYAVNDLKINHHFLFNTLNSMASMALDAEIMPLYESIVDLSRMFHYTLRRQQTQVTMREEWEYTSAYLDLQKFRYGDRLKVMTDFAPDVMNISVPFNFLQPVVENAFKHGCHEEERKELLIEIKKNSEVVIRVRNSGKTLSDAEYQAINQMIAAGTAHGLGMILRKLQMVYGSRCSVRLTRAESGGSTAVITFPADVLPDAHK